MVQLYHEGFRRGNPNVRMTRNAHTKETVRQVCAKRWLTEKATWLKSPVPHFAKYDQFVTPRFENSCRTGCFPCISVAGPG